MRNTIEARDFRTNDILVVQIGEDQFGDNVVFTKTVSTTEDPQPVSISFPLDAETARALSFALGELAKDLGKRK